MPHLAGVYIYPVKSLDPVAVPSVRVIKSGGLEGDRLFAMFNAEGKYVNGKKQPRVHHLQSQYDFLTRTLMLRPRTDKTWRAFQLDNDHERLQTWLAEYFGFPVTFKEDPAAGFPDDTDAPGPTVISVATLEEVASWFPGLTVEQIRIRFRANLEIGGVPAFWEDRLYGPKPDRVAFQIGNVLFHGNNPCQRCVVPPRDPFTGEGYPGFSQTFTAKREATLPGWAEKSRFNHYYRLAVNTLVPASEIGKVLQIGDEIRVIGPA
jgi:uncharacterized protein YcbX